MKFEEYNNNPKGNNVADCVIRSISFGLDMDYYQTYQELVNYSIQQGEGWLFNYYQSYGKYLETKGCSELEPFKIGKKKARVEDLSHHPRYKRGTYIIRIKGHLTVVRDGTLYDTWDCGNMIIKQIWEVIK